MACAVHTIPPARVGYTTLELKVNYVRAVTIGTGILRGEGTVLSSRGTEYVTKERRIKRKVWQSDAGVYAQLLEFLIK